MSATLAPPDDLADLELDDDQEHEHNTPRRIAGTGPIAAAAAAGLTQALDLGSARGTARQVGLSAATILRAAAGEPVTRPVADAIAHYLGVDRAAIWTPVAIEPAPPPAPPSTPGIISPHEAAAIIADARAQVPRLQALLDRMTVVAHLEPDAEVDRNIVRDRLAAARHAIINPN